MFQVFLVILSVSSTPTPDPERPVAYNKEVIVDIAELNKTQYHEQNFDTSELMTCSYYISVHKI